MKVKEATNKNMKNFLILEQLSYGCWRWIEHIGWVTDHFFSLVYVLSPMGGEREFSSLMEFDKKSECMFMKDKLNSEIVKNNEPHKSPFPPFLQIPHILIISISLSLK